MPSDLFRRQHKPPPPAPEIPRRQSFKRRAFDHYATEEFATRAALRHLPINGPFLEPCAGDGAICRVLEAARLTFEAYDLVDYGYGPCRSGVDFLSDAAGGPQFWPGCIFTNPPYDQGEAFVRRALRLTAPSNPAAPAGFMGGQVAMLLPHAFDAAGGRIDLWQVMPFRCKLVVVKRLKLIEGSAHRGAKSHAWYFWDWARGPAQLSTRWAK